MIKTIIIDDEVNARDFLGKLLARYFPDKFAICAKCGSVDEAVKEIDEHNPDLIFLDIQMPDKNGFELLKCLYTINFEVVFTTAFSEYAIKAIKHSAFDYLLKPINYIDLLSTVKRFEANSSQNQKQKRIELLLNNVGNSSSSFNKLTIPTENGFTLVNKSNILHAQADDNYCLIHLVDGNTITASKTLKSVEELVIAPNFFRVHKSYLVNLNYVKHFHKATMEIEMVNTTRLPVSHRKQSSFVKAITNNS
ncbi:LytTR family two component transcriptional regulator [Dokdonia sp. Hel_I_63]|uniref:LytR/AlgR family response regulator transcription factor n=1 Tax=Dokdonia sp. Hel_I_63 TaxID=1249996 RepID=UPI00119A2885|nr:LytTR family DNA-binding domain-containing protein [Dokdonia sp. Hel_I_63]TVZ24091.1 LytTR family two component transcriptional regulator [Dokdonia sp. Hel_I_63]